MSATAPPRKVLLASAGALLLAVLILVTTVLPSEYGWDPLGTGADLFGTRGMQVGPLIGHDTLWLIQVALVLIGHVYAIAIAHGVGHRLHRDRGAARRSLVPIPATLILISVAGLWIMHMDMTMRVGRM